MRSILSALVLFGLVLSGQVSAQAGSPKDIPISEFAALSPNTNVRLSPDGKNFLYLSKHQGRRVVVVSPITPNGEFKGVAIPAYDDMEIRWARWANNEYILVSMTMEAERHSFIGKQTETRLISVPIYNTKKAKNMAAAAKAKGSADRLRNVNEDKYSLALIQDYVVDILPNDPEHFLLGFDEDSSDPAREVRKVNVKKGTYKLVHDPSGVYSFWQTDQAGEVRLGYGRELVGTNLSDVEDQIMYRNPETGQWLDYTGENISDFDDFFILGFTEDPRFAYLYGTNEFGYNGLFIYDMIDLKITENLLSMEDRDVVDVLTDPYSEQIVGAYYHDNGMKYVYFHADYRKYQKMLDQALPDTVNWFVSRTQDGNRYILYSESDIDSGSYYLFDVPSKQLAFLTATYPGLDPRLMAAMNKVSYEVRDGLTIHGYLTTPVGKEAKNLPTVILPHGGPAARDYWGYHYLAQFLASRGYAVLQPNFRGSTGYGQDFEEAGRRQWGLKMQDDVTDGALWLVEQGIADPERMCIFGWSYGGYAALTAAFTTPDLFKCAVSVNGISDLHRLVTQESGYLGLSRWGELIGDPSVDEDSDRMKTTSAINNIYKIKIPVLTIVTKDDTVVNYQQSKRFHDEMQDAGKYSEYIELKEGNHSANIEPTRNAILENLERFLAQHIGTGN